MKTLPRHLQFRYSRLILFICFFLPLLSIQAGIWYVRPVNSGQALGTSWLSAFTRLDTALAVAAPGDEIWIAAGTYFPGGGVSDTLAFRLPPGVKIYGGFAGNESQLIQRNFVLNQTILSGDIGLTGDTADNSLHIIVADNLGQETLLDGLIITGGNASKSITHNFGSRGAAISAINSLLKIQFCKFTGNIANAGGAVYQAGGELLLQYCTFSNNAAKITGGGAICLNNNARFIMSDCSFFYNESLNSGGVMYVNGKAWVEMNRCDFSANRAVGDGSVLSSNSSDAQITFLNSLLVGNISSNGSVCAQANGFTNSLYQLYIINCTWSGNGSLSQNVLKSILTQQNGTLSVFNSIIYKNKSAVFFPAFADIRYCLTDIPFPAGIHIIQGNPVFKNPNIAPGQFMAVNYDYSLKIYSPALNAGNDSLYTHSDTLDYHQLDRIKMNIDLGAMEYQVCPLPVSILRSGPLHICAGQTQVFTASAGNLFMWQDSSATQSVLVDSAGTYSVTAYDTINGCVGTATDSVVLIVPSVTISGISAFCDALHSDTLFASGTGGHYLWNTGDTLDWIEIHSPDTFTVTLTDTLGCSVTSTRIVRYDTIQSFASWVMNENSGVPNDQKVCAGDAFVFKVMGAAAAYWSDGYQGLNRVINLQASDSFYIIAVSTWGCHQDTLQGYFEILPDPVFQVQIQEQSGLVQNDGILCSGDSFVLALLPPGTYHWNLGGFNSFVQYQASQTSIYSYTVTDSQGCKVSGQKLVNVDPRPQPLLIMEGDSIRPEYQYAAYQWYLNGQVLPGATTLRQMPYAPGSWQVEVWVTEDDICPGISKSFVVYPVNTQPEIYSLPQIFPNPFREKIQITGLPEDTHISMYSNSGVILYKGNVAEFSKVNFNNVSPGIYFLETDNLVFKCIKSE